GAAVIHAPIESPDLKRINDEIQKHGDFAESNFPDYKPHATIAYVDPAKAGRYTGMSVTAGKKFKVDQVAITDQEGKQDLVKLGGTPTDVLDTFRKATEPVKTASKETIDKVADIFARSEQPGYGADEVEERANGPESLADAVYDKLKRGESLGNVTELNKL